MSYRKIIIWAVLAFITFNSHVVSAQNAGRWYQVEILIFKRYMINDGLNNGAQQEQWRKDIQLRYPENYSFVQNYLPSSMHELGGYSYVLKRDEQYEVLFHEAWNQQMWGEARSPSFIIQAGKKYGQHHELEGSIKIHIGRFLHLSTNLWLNEFVYGDNTLQNNENPWPALPTLNNDEEPLRRANDPFIADQINVSRIVKFTEKRSMRSKETHYIDHPEMGILVRMLPIEK